MTTSEKEPDDVQRLRAHIDQSIMRNREYIPLIASFYRDCIAAQIDPQTTSCLTQIFFRDVVLRPPY